MEVTYVDHCGTDLSVVNAARVSFKKKSKLPKTSDGHWTGALFKEDSRLINYLANHKHHSPFNHSFISMHVKAPIFVARQLVKHKFMPWNEVSRRYYDGEPEFYWPTNLEWRGRSEDKKQGSEGLVILPFDMINPIEDVEPSDYEDYCLNTYNFMIAQGVAPEQARMVLPLNTYTEWYWSGTLGAWMDMYNLRAKEDTQWETRQVALMCGEIIQGLFPYSFEALTRET